MLKKNLRNPLRLMVLMAWGVGISYWMPTIASAQLITAGQPSVRAEAKAPAPPAAASVQALLTQFKVVRQADGKEKLEDASKVKPGDVIEYQVSYVNNSTKSVTGLVASLPIPEGLAYLPNSAKPGTTIAQMATRDGVFSTEPLVRTVVGKSIPVPYSDYRHIQWHLGQLPAHGITTVTARAQVESINPASSTNVAGAGVAGGGEISAYPASR